MTTASSPAAPASQRWTLLLAVALLALIVRLIYIWQISHAPFFHLRMGDAAAYHQWARRIVGGDWRGEGVFYQAPLYPYFLAPCTACSATAWPWCVSSRRSSALGRACCWRRQGMALFGQWGVVAGVLLAIYPSAIFLDGLLEKTALVTFFTAALLCVCWRSDR